MKKSNCIFGLRHKITYRKGFGYFCKRCGKHIVKCEGACVCIYSKDKTK